MVTESTDDGFVTIDPFDSDHPMEVEHARTDIGEDDGTVRDDDAELGDEYTEVGDQATDVGVKIAETGDETMEGGDGNGAVPHAAPQAQQHRAPTRRNATRHTTRQVQIQKIALHDYNAHNTTAKSRWVVHEHNCAALHSSRANRTATWLIQIDRFHRHVEVEALFRKLVPTWVVDYAKETEHTGNQQQYVPFNNPHPPNYYFNCQVPTFGRHIPLLVNLRTT